MFVCLLVCWSAFYRPHDICPLCGAASEWPREQEPPSRAAPHERARMHSDLARARARMPYNILSYTLLPRFSKKGNKKPTCNFPISVYSLPSLRVFTFRIVLNRILHKSSLLAPMESRRTRRPTFTAEERLERRRKQDRRRHAERRARQRREQTQAHRDVERLRSSQARASETVEETAARRDVKIK